VGIANDRANDRGITVNPGEFLDMGGYAFYVWSSWGMTLAVIFWNVVAPILQGKQLREGLKRDYRRNQPS
jgi:heme exporter protein D